MDAATLDLIVKLCTGTPSKHVCQQKIQKCLPAKIQAEKKRVEACAAQSRKPGGVTLEKCLEANGGTDNAKSEHELLMECY